jgi:hypothetical protein
MDHGAHPTASRSTARALIPPRDPRAIRRRTGRDASREAESLDRALAACGCDRSGAVRALAAVLASRFDGARASSGGRASLPPRVEGAAGDWLSGWRFALSDGEADPRARRLGPEAMARFHEAFAGEEGSVYTEPGEIHFMVRRALAEHLASFSPRGAALPRASAFRLLAATDASLPRVVARLAPEERRAAARRLASLRPRSAFRAAALFSWGSRARSSGSGRRSARASRERWRATPFPGASSGSTSTRPPSRSRAGGCASRPPARGRTWSKPIRSSTT